MLKKRIKRRDFVKTTAAAGASLLILPSGVVSGANAPSNKLNIALIGVYGRAAAHYRGLTQENVVALCDVDEEHLALAAEHFPNAKHYADWRKCLEQKDLDAVVCCTPDHTHAHIAIWAMNRGLHLYLEKPMGLSVEEVRKVRETYLKNKDKLAVQHGTQRHAIRNFNRVRELVRDGAIGELDSVHAWGNRQIRRDGYPAGKGVPPNYLNYDLWIGPSPYHPYNPEYFAGRAKPGTNCLNWNMYWDFGTGQVGDMGSHTMELAWNAIDADTPLSAEATGDEYNPEVTPVELRAEFKHPANDWRPEIDVIWHQGGSMPENPRPYVDLTKVGWGNGTLFKGSKGDIVTSFVDRLIIPSGDEADMTYYEPREKALEPMGNFQQEWIDACKTDLKTSCDFDYAGGMMEQMSLGLVAYRAGEKIEYDAQNGRVTNNKKANRLLSREYRQGWPLDG